MLKEPVFSMLLHRGHLITAGRDGAIRGWLWGKNMDKSGDIKVTHMLVIYNIIKYKNKYIHRDNVSFICEFAFTIFFVLRMLYGAPI